MKAQYVFLTVVLAVLFSAGWIVLPPDTHGAAPAKEKTPIIQQMEELAGGFRKLRRQVRKPEQNAATVKLIQAMQTAALKAKALLPGKIAAMPKEQHAAAVRPFKLKMIEMLATMLAVEKAVLESRNADAYELVKKMNVIKEEGHKAMGVGE